MVSNPNQYSKSATSPTAQIEDGVDFPHTGLIKALSLGMANTYAISGFNASSLSATAITVADGVIIRNGESPYGSNITISNADKYHRETYFVSVHTRNLATPQVAVASSGQSIGIGSGYNK